MAATVACIVLDVTLRALRWRGLLAPIARLRLPTVAASLLVGYLANNILPARLGELVRSHHLGDRTGVSRASILGTVVVERVVDTGGPGHDRLGRDRGPLGARHRRQRGPRWASP